jgi:23S rRNA pseudouridine1911/1915/1917 synthase
LKVLRAGPDDAGLRLDQWLAAALGPDMSRSRVQALIKAGHVLLGGSPADAKHRVAEGDEATLDVPEPEPATPAAQAIALDILFEDEDLVVLNKPIGLVVHPGAGNPDGTLVNALIHHCGDTLSGIGGVKRPGIVHRLDRDTSGVMVVAKNDTAHRALSASFADHGRTGDLERAYLAIAWGEPPRMTGTIDAPLGRAGSDRTRRAVVPAGRPDARVAVTHYRVLERFGAQDGRALASLIECRLETGRTHQIRVHMAHIGHPLVGDRAYGSAYASKANALPEPAQGRVRGFGRQALHAGLLAFRHPRTDELMRFEAPAPADFEELLDAFRRLTPEPGKS